MRDTLYLAVAYMRHNLGRSVILVLALALIVFVPLATRFVLQASEAQLTARAEATPLMIGARGSALDLMMNGLYYSDDRPELSTMADVDRVWDTGLATAIPLHVRFRAAGAPVVGTTLDYFDFRGLDIARGRSLAVLGEAVLGADLADRRSLGPGDTLISDPENLFDLAGTYPLEMQIVGILARTGTADDAAVLVDLNTAWVIQGLGHGHDDVVEAEAVVAETDGNQTVNSALRQFTRITEDNIDSFHFHGPPDQYPVSSIIAVPPDARAAAILRGRYLGPDERSRILVPGEVVQGLLATLFRIGRVLDAVFVVVGFAALVAVALAYYLSLKLRRGEVETAFKLGCHRSTIARLLGAEMGASFVLAILMAGVALLGLLPYMNDIAIWLITLNT